MDNKYLPQKEYRVYQVQEINITGARSINGLFDTGKQFQTHDLAYEWIETEGERQKTYTVVEEYRKP